MPTKDGTSPFTLNPNEALHSATEASPAAGHSADHADWRLTCVFAEDLSRDQLAELPAELRGFSLSEGVTLVGRQHQTRAFEVWLPDPILRFSISRTHVKFEVVKGIPSITNISFSLLCVDGKPIQRGEPCCLSAKQIVSFTRQEGSTSVHFLELQLQTGEDADLGGYDLNAEVDRTPQTPPIPAIPRLEADNVGLPALLIRSPPSCTKSSFDPLRSLSTETPGNSEPSDRGIFDEDHVLAAPPSMRLIRRNMQMPGLSPEVCSLNSSTSSQVSSLEIILVLHGDDVLDVPLEQRTIGPVSVLDRPLLVGRRDQPELHQRAVTQKHLEVLGRDRFCVAHEGGEVVLLALASRLIWLDRDGERPLRLARNDIANLASGDRIVLGIDADANFPDASRRKLCWHFRRVDEKR